MKGRRMKKEVWMEWRKHHFLLLIICLQDSMFKKHITHNYTEVTALYSTTITLLLNLKGATSEEGKLGVRGCKIISVLSVWRNYYWNTKVMGHRWSVATQWAITTGGKWSTAATSLLCQQPIKLHIRSLYHTNCTKKKKKTRFFSPVIMK